jgi:hypothetical protein
MEKIPLTSRICAYTNCAVLSRIKVPQLYAGLFVHNFILQGQFVECKM